MFQPDFDEYVQRSTSWTFKITHFPRKWQYFGSAWFFHVQTSYLSNFQKPFPTTTFTHPNGSWTNKDVFIFEQGHVGLRINAIIEFPATFSWRLFSSQTPCFTLPSFSYNMATRLVQRHPGDSCVHFSKSSISLAPKGAWTFHFSKSFVICSSGLN